MDEAWAMNWSHNAQTLPEARSWLADNTNRYSPFATNVFRGKEDVLSFVDGLYMAGAIRVSVGEIDDEPSLIESEGGPYAATLFVLLPNDKALAVRTVINTREPDEFSADEGDTLSTLRLWWD